VRSIKLINFDWLTDNFIPPRQATTSTAAGLFQELETFPSPLHKITVV